MRSLRLSLILTMAMANIALADKIVIGSDNPKKTKMFSIFHVINFPNSQCTILSTANTNLVMFGICVSSDTCTSSGGTADGNCASGFGVCCMHTVASCGSTISSNFTYIQNPGFPGSFGTTGTCSYNFKANGDVCQIRLDYNVLQVANPDANGNCQLATSDNVAVTSPTGVNPPVVCGLSTGQHIYFETNQQQNAGSIQFQIGTTNPALTRTWKIRATFLECSATWRAPPDCLQYLTGNTGSFRSFNYQTTAPQVLQSQNYNVCIRQNEGYCTNSYSVDNSFAMGVLNPFFLSKTGGVSKRTCGGASNLPHVSIPTTVSLYQPNIGPGTLSSNSDNYCGMYFNPLAGASADGVVQSQVTPFIVGVFSTNVNANVKNGAIGFALKYSQVAC